MNAVPLNANMISAPLLANPPRTAASYEQELASLRETEALLRRMLAREKGLLHQRDEAIAYQALMQKESDHRLLNDMQIVVSLLSMQSRASGNPETAAQLGIAANRISMIARIHRRLHGIDGMKTVAFRQYLEEFCHEFSMLLSLENGVDRVVITDGADMELPAAKAVPLALIVSELLTNAVKHGEGQIDVRLGTDSGRHRLSITNEGSPLPEGFDPAACKGLGMRIIPSFVRRIGGELHFGPGRANRGACFTVLFD